MLRIENVLGRIINIDIENIELNIDNIVDAIHKDKKQTSRQITAVLMYDDTSELREVSNRLAEIKQQMSELKEAIRQLEVRIEEGIQSRYRIRDLWKDLEDINTKRLSLRIQLSQLIKERSLLLSNTKIVSIVC